MYNKSLINGCNLVENQGLSTYNGLGAQQNDYAYEAFYRFLEDYRPIRLLEIGTGLGGFPQFLRGVSNDLGINVDIRTYDIHPRNDSNTLEALNIDSRVENIFNESYSEGKQEVINYIQEPGHTLVLCDGGNKIAEFNLLSNYIKTGDIIMAHDYAPNREYFLEYINLQLWNWLEISDEDINNCTVKNNLVPYMQDMFTQAVWVCKLKI